MHLNFFFYLLGSIFSLFTLLFVFKYKEREHLGFIFAVFALIFSLSSWLGLIILFLSSSLTNKAKNHIRKYLENF